MVDGAMAMVAVSLTIDLRQTTMALTAFRSFHSVAGVCTARTSAICNFFKRCGNVERTPLWCDRGLTFARIIVHVHATDCILCLLYVNLKVKKVVFIVK